MPQHKCKFKDLSTETGLDQTVIVQFISQEWLMPQNNEELDDEDIARARLIIDLRQQLGCNDEAIPVILHLIDQLHGLVARMKRAA